MMVRKIYFVVYVPLLCNVVKLDLNTNNTYFLFQGASTSTAVKEGIIAKLYFLYRINMVIIRFLNTLIIY
jgi:hypothetical protein